MVAGVWPTADCLAAGAGTVVKVWTPNEPSSEIKIFEGTAVYSLDFSRNNKVLAVAGDKGQVVVYSNKPQAPSGDRAVGRFPNLPEDGVDAITCVRFSPNDAHLVGGCKDGSVRVWSLRAKEDERVVTGLSGSATSVAINHTMEVLATASSSGQVLLHDFKTGAKWKSLARGGGPAAGSLCFSRPAPSLLAAATAAGALLVWDMDRLELAGEMTAHKGAVTGLCFSEASPELLLSCGTDGTLKCTDRRTQQVAWSVSSRQPFTALSAKHDGHMLAVGTAGGSVHVHDSRTISSGASQAPLSVQQFSDTSCPVTVVRWQHQHTPKSSRAASSVATASVAAGPSAATPAASAATASSRQQPQQGTARPATGAALGATGGEAARGDSSAAGAVGAGAGGVWPRSPVRPGGILTSEVSSTSVSVDFGMRVVSPVQLYGSPNDDIDANAVTSNSAAAVAAAVPAAAAAAGTPLHTPEPPAAVATPGDSLASAGPAAAPFMFTPGIGLGQLPGSTTPILTATSDITPMSRAPATFAPPAAAAAAAVPPVPPAVAAEQPAAAAAGTGSLSRHNSGAGLDTRLAAAAGGPARSGRAPLPAGAAGASSAAVATAAAAAANAAVGRGQHSRTSSSSSLPAAGGAAAGSRAGSRPGSAGGGPSSIAAAAGRKISRSSDSDAAPAAAGSSAAAGSRPGTAGGAAPGSLGSTAAAAAGEGLGSCLPSAAGAVGGVVLGGGVGVGGLREDVFKAYIDQQMAELRQDVKNMHLDMLRQFHQAQMDLVSVVDGLAQRQDQLAEAVGELAAAVQGMRAAKQHQQAGSSILMPWI